MTIIVNSWKIEDDTTFSFKSNPKRSGSKAHARYEIYQTATNLAEYLEACKDFSNYAKADLRYDTEKGHLSLLDADGELINKPTEATDTVEAEVEESTEEESIDEDNDIELDPDLDDTEELEAEEIEEDDF